MKKLLVVLGLLVLLPGLALAQGTYYVDYFANNGATAFPPGGAAFTLLDQIIRIINVGTLGTPLSAPVCPATGCICANIYVFDADQEMIACCAASLTPNELDSAYVNQQLTYNALQSAAIQTPTGVIKIVLTPEPTGGCNSAAPLSGADGTLGAVWATHLQLPIPLGAIFPPGPYSETESEERPQTLSAAEATFLPQACAFDLYLGSGKGTCTITVSSGQN